MSDELIHIRCIGCGKVLATKWNRYKELLGKGTSPEKAMKEIGLTRYCCKMWIQSPFKIPHRANIVEDIDIKPTEPLTIATPPQKPVGALQSMGFSGMPTQPGMPSIPNIQAVALPGIPTLSQDQDQETGIKKDVTRCYISW